VSTFVDTSVWSLALRRDAPPPSPQVRWLEQALQTGETIFTTGLVLQELLQGFTGPTAREAIVDRFAALPLVIPNREDHISAAELRISCRRKGVQTGTIDALYAQLCIRHELLMLSTDNDFERIAEHSALALWHA
jgi:predicted nucleic acid-binding protein